MARASLHALVAMALALAGCEADQLGIPVSEAEPDEVDRMGGDEVQETGVGGSEAFGEGEGEGEGEEPVDEDPQPWIRVPVHAVALADDDGGRRVHVTPEQVAAWVDEANAAWESARIEFVFDPFDPGRFELLDSTLLNSMNAELSDTGFAQDVAANEHAAEHPGRAVIMFRWGPFEFPTGMGYSSPLSDYVAMPGFPDTGVCGHQAIGLLSHEIGHFLGLGHTFGLMFDTLESAGLALSDAGLDLDIFDGDGLGDTPPDPGIVEIGCDLDVHEITLAGVTFPIPRDNIMAYMDARQKRVTPRQAEIARQVALLRLGRDLRDLIPRATLMFEGEDLVVEASDGWTDIQPMMGFSSRWSGDAELLWNADRDGRLSLTLTVPEAGRWQVYAGLTTAPQFGIHEAVVGEQRGGLAVNTYAKFVYPTGPVPLGTFELQAGDNTLVIENVGADPRAALHSLGLDYLLLAPLAVR